CCCRGAGSSTARSPRWPTSAGSPATPSLWPRPCARCTSASTPSPCSLAPSATNAAARNERR
ncbi:MAG: hypothetical protein AVDCRST_MAG11-3984, partial [uncultured Gemmatimonadaceae bacterium]